MKLVMGDITKMKADAVVIPASTDLRPQEGISKAVFNASDKNKLMKACRKIGHCAIGRAVVTPSFGLDYRFIIHTAGAGWYSGREYEKEVFRDCYKSALSKAYAYGCRTLALPLMFSGSMHIPRAEALLIVRSVIEDFERIRPEMEISLVLYKKSIYDMAEKIFSR